MHVVLLVHKHGIYRAGLKLLLLYELGLRVVEAADTRSAIEHLRGERVDLLVLDIGSPNTGSLNLIKYAKKYRPTLPVVALAAEYRQRTAARAKQLGAHIIAPHCQKEEFISSIRTIQESIANISGTNTTPPYRTQHYQIV